ncbi:COX15/CtaA family protein, partial [Caenispirillum bisanense]|uniref:COX15/CtaA family protein n=1 Tax=Caenispirillum bisanense TaxID=414052 RepID=UPI0031CF8EF0
MQSSIALDLPSAPHPVGRAAAQRRAVAVWLFVLCAMVAVMVGLGGATRLTDSGLSMVEWQPLTVLPPLTEADWQTTFEKYRQFPEYQKKNYGMTLAEFKGIFWLEYLHRLWGRAIGVVFALPFLWFLARGAIDRPLALKLGGLFVLGGLQGLVGWLMVKSGLVDQPMVSPLRLAAHLGLAFLILLLMLRLAVDLWLRETVAVPATAAVRRLATLTRAFVAFAFAVVLSGALVAGLDAGLTYNTFPLMDGRLVPNGLHLHSPWWVNHLDNVTMVQFQHRLLAVTVVGAALLLAACTWRQGEAVPARARHMAAAVAALALAQMSLGIATLLLVVPVSLGVAHQLGALALLSAATVLLRLLRTPPPPPASPG